MWRRPEQGQLVRESFPPPSSKPKLRKGLWSPEEDEKLIAYVIDNGVMDCSWAYVAKQAGLQRCGKSCRLRWINYLRPGLKRGAFSRQEERLIIKLQSILGNRWSQIAAHMPGRTDNEIKNYWNSSIKKTLKLKHQLSSTTNNCTTDAKSANIPSQSDSICNTNSVFLHHAHADALKLCHSTQPYLDAMPEGYKTPNNTFNVVSTGENLFCVPAGVLESNQEQVQDQKDEFNQLISSFEMWINENSIHTHDSVPSRATFISPNLQAQGLHTHTDDWFHVVNPGAYIAHEAGISIMEDYKRLDEKTTHQSWPPLNFRSQFGAPAIKLAAGQSNDFQEPRDDCKDRLNLRYDVNLGIPKYMDIYRRRKSYQLPQTDREEEISDQWDLPKIPQEETNSNPDITIFGGRGSGPSQIEGMSGTGQVPVWAHDDI